MRNLESSSIRRRLTANLRRTSVLAATALGLAAQLSLVSERVDATVLSTPPTLSLSIEVPGTAPQVIPVPLRAGPGGTFFADGSTTDPNSFSLDYSFAVVADPSVSGTFSLTNLSDHTQTFSVSATLGTSPLAGPTRVSGFYGQGELTAPIGTPEAQLTADPFYQARIDGATVQALGSKLTITTSGGTAPIPMQSFLNQPGPAVTSSIGVAFLTFTLTAHHTVETPFDVTVLSVPEPASVALLILGLAIVFVRWKVVPAALRSKATADHRRMEN